MTSLPYSNILALQASICQIETTIIYAVMKNFSIRGLSLFLRKLSTLVSIDFQVSLVTHWSRRLPPRRFAAAICSVTEKQHNTYLLSYLSDHVALCRVKTLKLLSLSIGAVL